MLTAQSVGEIVHAGQILDPDKAQQLGDTVLSVFDEYVSQPFVSNREKGSLQIDPSDQDVSEFNADQCSNRILLGAGDRELVSQALSTLAVLVRGKSGAEVFDAEFFVGTPGGGAWHFDGQRQHRLLVNLSRSRLRLLVAKAWDANDYEDFFSQTRFRPDGPTDKSQIGHIDYGPGEGVLLDNMRDEHLQVPHAGMRAKGKVFMRLQASRTAG